MIDYALHGYDFYISINGSTVPKSMVHGEIKIIKNKNQASIAEFTLLHADGVQYPEQYQGAAVTINLRTAIGIYRVFTGTIELPELDIIEKKTKYRCTDNKELKIKQLGTDYIRTIGTYSNIIFGEPKDIVEELNKRVSTIPYYFGISNYGTTQLVSWTPKSTPDFLLTASQIYYREPSVKYTPRATTTNTINISFSYGYQRCFQKSITYSWAGYSSLYRWLTQGRPSFPTKEAVKSAAEGVGWYVPNITYTNLWPAQGVQVGSSIIIWQPNKVDQKLVQRRDAQGNPVNSALGDPVYDTQSTTITDLSSGLCRGATWTAYKRWTQAIQESYTVSVYSPQSVAKFGTNPSDETFSLASPYEANTWENSTPDATFLGDYVNQDINRVDLNSAFTTILKKAHVTLLQSHRDVEVNFQTPLFPNIDMFQTIEIDMYKIECKGIVTAITHVIDVKTSEAYTDVVLELSRINGSASQSNLAAIPAVPSENLSYTDFISGIALPTNLGLNPADHPELNGYFGNVWEGGSTTVLGVRTTYPEAFIVDSPPIPDTLREARDLTSTASYIVSIPNDPLVVRY